MIEQATDVRWVPRPRPDVSVRNLDGTLWLRYQDQVLELSDTAAFVWRSIQHGVAVADLIELVCQEYDAPASEVGPDVLSLLASLMAADFVPSAGGCEGSDVPAS